MRDSIKGVIVALVIVFAVAMAGIGYTLTIEKWPPNAEREVFKQTTAYSEAAASFLADSYKQYNDAETEADKNTIMEYVVMRYPNLDTNSIDNDTLRRFYNQCLNH